MERLLFTGNVVVLVIKDQKTVEIIQDANIMVHFIVIAFQYQLLQVYLTQTI